MPYDENRQDLLFNLELLLQTLPKVWGIVWKCGSVWWPARLAAAAAVDDDLLLVLVLMLMLMFTLMLMLVLMLCGQVIVSGIPSVERAVISKEKDGKHNLLVEGTNMQAVMATAGGELGECVQEEGAGTGHS